jgi:large subunit ribosomal protein L14
MIQLGSLLRVSDKTCAVIVQCIKVFCPSKIAYLGNLVLVSLSWINKKKFARLKLRLQQKFLKGSLHRGLLIRSKMYFVRSNGIRIKFDENTVVLVTKNVVPVSNRVYGPVLREFCERWPSLGCVSNCII